ncbi:MAG TPA: redoxin domain-containing protein [Terriglobia bacterium]|nr:redoxin domain-containing protein [Terriglobia bacterium]
MKGFSRLMRVAFAVAFVCQFGQIVVRAQSFAAGVLNVTHFRAPEFPLPSEAFANPTGLGASASPGGLGPGSLPGQGRLPTEGGAPTIPSPNEGGNQGGPQPGFSEGVTWINSPPLTMEKLGGKVVLIDFWEYTCINCIRTFATNKKWYERYHRYGFEIIGVHDPEFDVAYPVQNVRVAVKRFGLPYPIVVDDHFQIWNAYHNSTWPNRFLIDAKGVVRFNRSGEGGDDAMEKAIQMLLLEAHPGLKFPASYTTAAEKNTFGPDCGIPTEEVYVGNWYGRGILANPKGYRNGKTLDYKLPGEVQDGKAAVSGRWETDKNGMIYRGKPKKGSFTDRLEMRYHARELYAVMNVSHGHPQRLYIRQDGKDLTAQNKGVDVRLDAQGRSYIEVREPRMYYLVQNPDFGAHGVDLYPTAKGITVNSFTFGNNCQTDFPHL